MDISLQFTCPTAFLLFFFFFFNVIYFYFWWCPVFVDASFSLVAVSRGYCIIAVHRVLTVVASLVAEHEPQGAGASGAVAHGLSCSMGRGIFLNQGSIPWIGRWILIHCTIGEVPLVPLHALHCYLALHPILTPLSWPISNSDSEFCENKTDTLLTDLLREPYSDHCWRCKIQTNQRKFFWQKKWVLKAQPDFLVDENGRVLSASVEADRAAWCCPCISANFCASLEGGVFWKLWPTVICQTA